MNDLESCWTRKRCAFFLLNKKVLLGASTFQRGTCHGSSDFLCNSSYSGYSKVLKLNPCQRPEAIFSRNLFFFFFADFLWATPLLTQFSFFFFFNLSGASTLDLIGSILATPSPPWVSALDSFSGPTTKLNCACACCFSDFAEFCWDEQDVCWGTSLWDTVKRDWS